MSRTAGLPTCAPLSSARCPAPCLGVTTPQQPSRSTPDPHVDRLRARIGAVTGRLPAPLRIVVVTVVGGGLLLAGLAMLVLPGPDVVVTLAGLAVLAAEFPWARHALAKIRTLAARGWRRSRPAVMRCLPARYRHRLHP